jgi:hypothetical protein
MALRGAPGAMEMLTLTLDRMAGGGMYDQVGGGFARYSTDAAWRVPHFEKMLYDNAQLAMLYTHAWLATRRPLYEQVAKGTLDYLLREMRHAAGGFFSSQDADTEGEEGRFYTWPWQELAALVGMETAESLGASPEGNWEGTNVLMRPPGDAIEVLELLSRARAGRPAPAIDDKVLTAWNALAIRALAEAGRAFREVAYVEAAIDCARFVSAELRGTEGRLLRSWRDGTKGGPGFSDDHALLVHGLLSLYETTGDVTWFEEARRTADDLITLFADDDRGGFFQTGSGAEALVIRPKEIQDNSVPSGNSAAAEALQRLALFTGEVRYERAAVSALRLVRDLMIEVPVMFGAALCALDLHLGPTYEVAIVGDPAAIQPLLDEVFRSRYLPNVVVAVGDGRTKPVALLDGRTMVDGKAAAYVCLGFVCEAPATEPQVLAQQVSG